MSTEPLENEQEPKRRGRRVADVVENVERKKSSGRRALVLDEPLKNASEPEFAPEVTAEADPYRRPRHGRGRAADLISETPRTASIEAVVLPEPVTDRVDEFDLVPERTTKNRRRNVEDELILDEAPESPVAESAEATVKVKSVKSSFLILAIADMIAIAVFFFFSFVTNNGKLEFSGVGLAIALLIMIASFVFVARKSKGSREDEVTEEDVDSVEDEVTPEESESDPVEETEPSSK